MLEVNKDPSHVAEIHAVEIGRKINNKRRHANDEIDATGSDPPQRGKLDPTRCHFYLTRKRRYCRTIPKEGVKFCVEHAHLNPDAGDYPVKKRIPCPLDPKHSCYEAQLDKHLKKCNAREGQQPIYYTKNINCGSEANSVPKVSLSSTSTDEVLKMVERIRHLYSERVPPVQEEMLFHNALKEEIEKESNGPAAQKHLRQNASLVGHLEKLGLLCDGQCFIEFGAGKGGLSHWVQRGIPNATDAQYILVEKGSIRYKMDSYHKGEDQGPSFERLRIDIQHLDLDKVPSLAYSKRPIVGLGKHLCGGATDLMLRCLVQNSVSKTNDERDVSGIVLALCCHHRCDWASYVGTPYLEELGLSAGDMHLITSMTSWATCATRTFLNKLKEREQSNSNGDDATVQQTNKEDRNGSEQEMDYAEHSSQETDHPRYGDLTPEAREEVGYMCKRLLDWCRVRYLQEHNYDARLVAYTTPEYSLENIALLATKKLKK